MTGERLEKCFAGKYTAAKNNALLRISIGFHLMCLITFPFYCVKGKMMKMVDENGGDAHRYDSIWLWNSREARWVCIFYTPYIQE